MRRDDDQRAACIGALLAAIVLTAWALAMSACIEDDGPICAQDADGHPCWLCEREVTP